MARFRTALLGGALAAIAACNHAAPPIPAAAPPVDPAEALHRSAIVIDTHDDITQRLVTDRADIAGRVADAQTDLPRMREGGLDAEFLSVYVPPKLFPGEKAYARSIEEIDAIDAFVARHPDTTVLARTAADVRGAAASGKTAFLIGVEGGHSLGDAPDDELIARLRGLYDRGARYMTLTWATSNRLGGSSGDEGKANGLTAFGRRVVETMNALGMMVDVSHVSDATFYDAVAASKSPVLASHSSARALADHPRNMTDDMLRAVARSGGAVCINFGPEFLDLTWRDKYRALQKEAAPKLAAIFEAHKDDPNAVQIAVGKEYRELAASLPPVPGSVVIDHIEHVAKVAGVDHVCLGSDYDGVPIAPAGLDDVSKLPFVTRELLKRGFPPDDIKKILGENVLRVLAANERNAGRLSAR